MFIALTGLAWGVPMPDLTLKLPSYPLAARELCYPSGLKVQAIRRPNTGIVAVSTVVGGGWGAEAPDERGSAHLLEHVWLDRARPNGGDTVVEALSGLDVDGFTTDEATIYITIGAPIDLGPMLNVEALRLTDPLAGVDESAIEVEQAIVRSELLWRGEASRRLAYRALSTALWGVGPHQTTTIEENDALTLDSVRRYAQRVYTPAETTIRVEGDLDPEAIDALMAKAFPNALLGGAQKACVHNVTPLPARLDTKTATVEGAVIHPVVLFGWALPPGRGPDDALFEVLAHWLGAALVAELGRVRRMDEDDVALWCSYNPGARASSMTCSTPLTPGARPEQVVAQLRATLKREFQQELERGFRLLLSKTSVFDGALMDADGMDVDALADRALFGHIVDGQLDPLPLKTHGVLQATLQRLEATGREWMSPEKMASVALVPGRARLATAIPYNGKARLSAPPYRGWQVPEPDFTGWRVDRRQNGLNVWTIPRPGGSPVSFVGLAFDQGAEAGPLGSSAAFDKLAYPNFPHFDAMVNGTATGLGNEYDGGRGSLIWAYGPSGNLDAQLFSLRHLVDELTLVGRPSVDFLPRKQYFDRFDEDAGEIAFGEQRSAVLAGTDWAAPWWELFDAMRTLKRADAKAWQQSVLRPDRGALIVSGWVTQGEVDKEVGRYLDSWRVRPAMLAPPPPLPAPAARKVRAYDDNTILADVSLRCRLPARSIANDAALDVLDVLAEEGLTQTLRDPGGNYALFGYVEPVERQASILTLSAVVAPDGAAPALQGMQALVALLAEGPDEALLDWAKRTARMRFAQQLASGWSSLVVARGAISLGLSLEKLRAWPARVEAVDAAAIQGLLTNCVGNEAMTYIGPSVDLTSVDAEWRDWPADAKRIVSGPTVR